MVYHILEGSEPIGLLESQADRFRRRAITEEADSFLDTDRPGMDPILLAAIKRSKDAEPLEGFKGQLPSYLGDHPDLVGGETPNPSLSINSTAETPITPPTPSTLVSSGTNTSATTNSFRSNERCIGFTGKRSCRFISRTKIRSSSEVSKSK